MCGDTATIGAGTSLVPGRLVCSAGVMSAATEGLLCAGGADLAVGVRDELTTPDETARATTTSSVARRAARLCRMNLDKSSPG